MLLLQQRRPACRERWSPGSETRSLLLLLPLILLFTPTPSQGAIHIPNNYKTSSMKQPPIITQLPESSTVFSLDDINLSCEAEGTPTPSFRWEKDGKELEFDRLFNGSGTIKAEGEELLSSYHGEYRCYASNELGTAMSTTVTLITETTPTLSKEVKVEVKATAGDSVVLRCDPPKSSTPPTIHWMDRKLNHIVQTDRITTGVDGNLYFANVQNSDQRNDYTCNAYYVDARTILPKEAISLKVKSSNTVDRIRKPRLLHPQGGHHHSSTLALLGHSLVLECIPEGLPTPSVRWKKMDGKLEETGGREEKFGRWLKFDVITQRDDGEYKCISSNSQGTANHSYTVTVEAEPYWVKQPESLRYAPGETVRLDCLADGVPHPDIVWRINGVNLADVDEDSRRSVTGGVLILNQVRYSDTAVYQCEATNKHGSILINTYIHVIALPPQILSSDGVVYQVTEGGNKQLHCEAFGSPRPHITWESEERAEPSLVSDPRVSLLTNGTLEITNVGHDDTGTYICSLRETNITIFAHLEVLNRTAMLIGPQEKRVIKDDNTSLDCLYYKDPKLSEPTIIWKKDGEKIIERNGKKREDIVWTEEPALNDLPLDDRYQVLENGTLIMFNVQSEDGGQYSCDVITDLDTVHANGSITVVDVPDPPEAISLSELQDRSLTLSWRPGDTHNSPTTGFVVEVREEQHSDRKSWEWEEVRSGQVSGDVNHLELPLQPYSTYRFRVIAVNALGRSKPSLHSEPHSTPPAVPDSNPTGVHSNSTDPHILVILWDEMDSRLHNGQGFQYKVSWRQAEGHVPHWSDAYVERPPFSVNASGPFTPYEIKVRAVNKLGDSIPEAIAEMGHTGEDFPEAFPSGVQVLVLNSTIIVTWEPMTKKEIQGHLKEFKIYVTWLGTQGGTQGARKRRALENREQDRERLQERERRGGEERGMVERVVVVDGARFKEEISGLRLYSRYELDLTVVNSKGEGPHSPKHSFFTPEGAPGPPASLSFESPSDSELTIHWQPPTQPNGVITGYLLQYHPIVEPQNADIKVIKDPLSTYYLIDGLDPHSRYLFSLFAHTSAGKGLPITQEGATLLDGVPPSNISMVAGETSVNLSWVPGERYRNHGFHIKWKTVGGEWEESELVNSTQAFYSLRGLQPGTEYALVIHHGNGTHWEGGIQTEGPMLREVAGGFATQGWFIGLISAIVLLMLLLLILCFIKRSKGGKYAVKDKEEGQVDSEARLKDETFGEYRSLESDGDEKRSVSQPSLAIESKLGSDDSLAEYGDSVDIQFNEDGSFIGQYSGRDRVPHDNESSGPASPVNPAPPPPLAPSLSAILNPPS